MKNIIVTFCVILCCLCVNDVQGRSISIANYKTDPGFELRNSQVCNGLSYLRAIVADKSSIKDPYNYVWLFSKTGDISGRWEILDSSTDTVYTADEIEDGKKGYYRVALENGNGNLISNAVYLEPHDCQTPHYHWSDFHFKVLSCEGPWWCVWWPVNIDTLRISTTEYYDYTVEILDGASLEDSEAEITEDGISLCYYLPEPVTDKDSVTVVLRSGDYADTTRIYYDFVKEIYDTTSITICHGDSVQIGDTTLKTTGTYTINMKTEAGCDHIVTVNFYVIPPKYEVTDAAICKGESYLWNGKYYDQTGTYYDTITPIYFHMDRPDKNYGHTDSYYDSLQNSQNCDVYCTLNLKVNDVYRDTTYIEFCKDENHKVSGITIDSMLSISGCDSIRITNMKVHPTYFDTTFATVKQGETFTFNNKEYSEDGFYEKTYTTIHGCDSLVVLKLRVLKPVIKTENVAICENEHFQWRGNDYDASGRYTDTVSKTGVGDSIFILNLIVNVAYKDSSYIQICEDEEHRVSCIRIDSMLSISGCDSIRITHLKVHPTYFDTTFATIKQGETFVFNNTEYSKAGVYETTYTTTYGCDSMITLNLKTEFVNIIPMSYFTPNGDGVNDVWIIKNIELLPDAKVTIFDRYGKRVATFPYYDNETNAWDGTYNGNDLPATDYWYTINIESLDKIYSGHFTLIR
ncbi:MAG: T9SS type B sorting domain-containing protein [Bacteroidales bacterium]|nr:T9SS type B sorting domain-containing protein [Candidatus Physcocola equi]